ncbi:MAG: GNAT family N-acetyltransferase [Agathobacter sp.]|nr:GNAT family N-acetyltransferase [Agathobacter sp.]
MELVSNYMRDDTLRHALNDLTRKTFGFDFEGWVTDGYFEGDYIPYSFVENGKVISNVSANRMCFLQNGVKRNYIQIGTVMTDEAYRKRGLAKKLIEHVTGQYADACDGIYLFANLDALGFYDKCGFLRETEYRYWVKDEFCREKIEGERFAPVNPLDVQMKQKYMDTVRNSAVNSAFEQTNKFGLQMFYTADMEDVYYARDMDCFIVAKEEGKTLLLQSIICDNRVALSDVLSRIGTDYSKCRLGFAPAPKDSYRCTARQYDGSDDYWLFYLGEQLKSIEREKLYFPELSHA